MNTQEEMLFQIRKRLLSSAEPKYRDFSAKLLPEGENLLGVRIPVLRKYAKQLGKIYGTMYLDTVLGYAYGEQGSEKEASTNLPRDEVMEEILLQGMVIGNLKAENDVQLAEILGYIRKYLPKITNWSTCDSFCAGLKIAKQYPEQMWHFLQEYFTADQEFSVRFGIVMIINYYINGEYFNRLFPIFDAIGAKHHEYYVEMALAWAISICYIHMPEETKRYIQDMRLKPEVLDNFTYRMALQKIVDSHCVSNEEKAVIRGMKRANE